jgi:hypothetical protein
VICSIRCNIVFPFALRNNYSNSKQLKAVLVQLKWYSK